MHPPLRKWQEEAFWAWKRAGCRGIVAVVTGGGKTAFALHCLDGYRTSVPGATALIVVPTNALLEQWIEETVDYYDIPMSHIVVLKARSRIQQSRINIGVINTVARLAPANDQEPLFLIVDECHRAASDVFQNIFAVRTDATLGLSATPERQYDRGLEDVLLPNLGPVIIRYGYEEALKDGVIVPFTLRNILFEFDDEEQKQYDKLTRLIKVAIQEHGLESDRAVRLMIRRTRISNLSLSRVRIASALIARNPGRSILLFHEDIAACDLIAQVLRENGVAAGLYHSRMPFRERVRSLAKYRSKDISVLVTCRALDEGFNAPATDVGIIAAATSSYRQRIQRLGRILRPAGGKSRAVVYSIVASIPEIRRLADEAKDLDGVADVIWTRA